MTVFSIATSLIACSGPNAGRIIAENSTYAMLQSFAVFALACTAYWLYSQFACARWPVIVIAILFAIHPAWTISATKGDCGDTKATAATVFTGVAIGLTAIQVVRPAIRYFRKSA
jgi:hypothetical protein